MSPQHLGSSLKRASWLLLYRRRRGRRRRCRQQKAQHLPRQRFGIDQGNQDQPEKDCSIEEKGCDHPASAAGLDSACRFERGIFKHGVPPARGLLAQTRPQALQSRRNKRHRRAISHTQRRNRRGRGVSTTPATKFCRRGPRRAHPVRNHCASVDTTPAANVPTRQNIRPKQSGRSEERPP